MAAKSDPKGEFTADISEDLVAEALRAVEQRAEVSALERAEEQAKNEAEHPDGAVVDLEEAGGAAMIEVADEIEAQEGAEGEEEVLAVEASPAGEEDSVEALRARIATLEEELRTKEELLEDSLQRGREMMERLQEASDRYARQVADMDNARKRALREKEEGQRFAIERLLRELLPVLDNFDRALEHVENSVDLKTFGMGVEMTRKQFLDTLGKFGVASFEAVGQPFDPNFHEAMEHVESDEHPANVVIAEMVRGYTLHERLIRPALVSVSKGPAQKVEAATEPEGAVEAAGEEQGEASAPKAGAAPATGEGEAAAGEAPEKSPKE